MDYATYVRSLVPRYPSLTALADLLGQKGSQLTSKPAKSILSTLRNNIVNNLSTNECDNILVHIHHHTLESQKTTIGLNVLLEDPSAILIEELGITLDINLLFFAGYIAIFYELVEKRPLAPVTVIFLS